MFGRKKTKLDLSLPKPPTKAEILDDLSTFCIDRTTALDVSKRCKSSTSAGVAALASIGDSPKSKGLEQDVHLGDWWNRFEVFLNEVDDLENYQKQFDAKRKNLEKLDCTIQTLADDMHGQINKAVQNALAEAADIDNDLK